MSEPSTDTGSAGRTGNENPGLIHTCFGHGAGKTSRAVGLAIRAAGSGLNVHFIQFMKSGDSGEVGVLKTIPGISYRCPGRHTFIMGGGPRDLHFQHAAQAYEWALEAARAGTHVLVCDEILNTLPFGLLEEQHLLDLIALCRGRTELMMTGRDAPAAIIEASDYVTELVMHKHPYNRGVQARKGVEF